MVNTSRHSVKAAAALMEEALEILDRCEALVPAMHLWTALQALGATEAGFPSALAGMQPTGGARDSHSPA